MKTTLMALGLVLALNHGSAQVVGSSNSSFPPGSPDSLSLQNAPLRLDEVDALMRVQTEMVYRLAGFDFRVTGVVPQAIKSPNPWHMINPFAPPEYGNGFQNVSVNPITGRAEGIRLLGIKF